jgi:hypothetical protein
MNTNSYAYHVNIHSYKLCLNAFHQICIIPYIEKIWILDMIRLHAYPATNQTRIQKKSYIHPAPVLCGYAFYPYTPTGYE